MYVDRSCLKAVQTLSRLNRGHPQGTTRFVLDFLNDFDTIELAFADCYRTTILSEKTDPDKLHDLKGRVGWAPGVYSSAGADALVGRYLDNAERAPQGRHRALQAVQRQ
jgi:type I restriction enzyme R subunit